jgi:hypothetical protein
MSKVTQSPTKMKIAMHYEPKKPGLRSRHLGRLPVSTPLSAALTLLAACLALAGCDFQARQEKYTAKQATLVADGRAIEQRLVAERALHTAQTARVAAEKAEADLVQRCRDTLPAKRAEYQRLLAAREYWPASVALNECARKLDDAGLLALVKAAQRKSYLRELKDAKSSSDSISAAARWLSDNYPKEAAGYKSDLPRLLARSAAYKLKAARIAKKSTGVSIGMDRDEVIASSWGRPQSTNRTTTASGSHEQWVYRGYNFLYFENGKLTAIQN